MIPPTVAQVKILRQATRHPRGRMVCPENIDQRRWQTYLVKMHEKDYILWEGPRAFISELGRYALACVEKEPNLTNRVSGKYKSLPELPLVRESNNRRQIEYAD